MGDSFNDRNLVQKCKTGLSELGETLFPRRMWRTAKLRRKFENLQSGVEGRKTFSVILLTWAISAQYRSSSSSVMTLV